MTEEQQKKELEIALTNYIALKHTQEECVGFIDGFKEALSLFAVSGRSEQLISFLEWRDKQNILTLHDYTNEELVRCYLKEINCH